MPKKIEHAHDAFFKKNMSDHNVARAFFETYLPLSIKSQINLNSLKLLSSASIDRILKKRETDMLFSVELTNQQDVLYLLLEHLSNPEHWYPLRKLEYEIEIMRYHVTEAKNKYLPLIYTIVYYTGKKPYNKSQNLFSLYGAQENKARKLFTKPFDLIEINQFSDKEIIMHAHLNLMELSSIFQSKNEAEMS